MKSTAQRFMVLVVMVVIAGLLQMAMGQDQQRRPGGPGQGMRMSPKERAEALAKQLSLDSLKTANVEAVYEKYQKIMIDKRMELQGDMDAMRAAMAEIREKQNKEIVGLLTEEQAKKFEEIQKTLMQRGPRPQRNN
jgi:hypothetical protein